MKPADQAIPPPLPTSGADAFDRRKEFEATLSRLGLDRLPSSGLVLQYSGVMQGRKVGVTLSRRSRTTYAGADIAMPVYYGHRLDLVIETPVSTRLSVSWTRSGFSRRVARLIDRSLKARRLPPPASLGSSVEVSASEPEWALRFLQRPEAAVALVRLIPNQDLLKVFALKWSPGDLALSQVIDLKGLDGSLLEQWLSDLLELAALAEAYPPSIAADLSQWEKWVKRQPVIAGCLVVATLGASILLLGLIVSALLVGLAIWLSR